MSSLDWCFQIPGHLLNKSGESNHSHSILRKKTPFSLSIVWLSAGLLHTTFILLNKYVISSPNLFTIFYPCLILSWATLLSTEMLIKIVIIHPVDAVFDVYWVAYVEPSCITVINPTESNFFQYAVGFCLIMFNFNYF